MSSTQNLLTRATFGPSAAERDFRARVVLRRESRPPRASGGPLDACVGYVPVHTRRTMHDIQNAPKFSILADNPSNIAPSRTGSSPATLYTQYIGNGMPCGSCGSSAWEGACSRRADDSCWGATQRRCNIDWVNVSCMCPRLPDGAGAWVAATVGGTARENCGRGNSTCSWPSNLLLNLTGAVELLTHARAAKLPPAFTAGFIDNLAERVRVGGGLDADLSDMAEFEKEARELVELARGLGDETIGRAAMGLVAAYLEPHCFQLRRIPPSERGATDKDNVGIVYGTRFLSSGLCRFWRNTLDQREDASVVADALGLKEMFDNYCDSDVRAVTPAQEAARLRARVAEITGGRTKEQFTPDMKWMVDTLEHKAATIEYEAGVQGLAEHPVDADVKPATTAECDCKNAGTQISADTLRKLGFEDTTKPLPNFYRATRESTEEVQIQADRLSREVIRRTYGLVSTPVDRHCWFKPCDGTNTEFVSSTFRNTLTCPSVVCQANIVVDRTGNNVTIANNNFNIQCSGERNVPCPEGMTPTASGCVGTSPNAAAPAPRSTATPSTATPSSADSTGADSPAGELGSKFKAMVKENAILLAAVGAAIVLVVVIFLIIRARRRRNVGGSGGASGAVSGGVGAGRASGSAKANAGV